MGDGSRDQWWQETNLRIFRKIKSKKGENWVCSYKYRLIRRPRAHKTQHKNTDISFPNFTIPPAQTSSYQFTKSGKNLQQLKAKRILNWNSRDYLLMQGLNDKWHAYCFSVLNIHGGFKVFECLLFRCIWHGIFLAPCQSEKCTYMIL